MQALAHVQAPAIRRTVRARRLRGCRPRADARDAANRYVAVMPYDPACKLLFAHPRMAEDLLRGFVANGWSHALDFRTLELRPAASVSDDLRRREGDLLWRVRLGGTWLYVQLEFQSTVDPTMAVRLLSRTGLLYQDLLREGEVAPGGPLPPVLPVVLYNGRRSRWTAAVGVGEMMAPVEAGLARYQPSLRYELLDVGEYGADDLPARNLVSVLIGLENSRTPGELGRWLDALLDRVRGPGERELRRAFGAWIRRVLLAHRFPGVVLEREAELEEVRTMLEEQVREWTQQWFEEGREEGHARGIAEERALLCRMTARKFDAATAERLSGVLNGLVDPERLAEVGEWIIECETGAELLDRAGSGRRALDG